MNNSGKTTVVNDHKLYDVFLGRGNGVAKKHGNLLYRQTIEGSKKKYKSAHGKRAKDNVTTRIIDKFTGKGGTFYIKKGESGEWVPSPMDTTVAKIKQALREPGIERKKYKLFKKETSSVKMDVEVVDRLMSLLPDSTLQHTNQDVDKCCNYASMNSAFSEITLHGNRSSVHTMSSSISSTRASLHPPSEDDIQVTNPQIEILFCQLWIHH